MMLSPGGPMMMIRKPPPGMPLIHGMPPFMRGMIPMITFKRC